MVSQYDKKHIQLNRRVLFITGSSYVAGPDGSRTPVSLFVCL